MTDFGRDVSCGSSLRTGRYATGVRLLGEALYRRLTTPRGMLRGGEDEANYGLDLMDMIGSVQTKSDAAALGGRVRAEVLKDERVNAASVDVVLSAVGPVTTATITISVESDAGPFDLVLGVSDVTVEILRITE